MSLAIVYSRAVSGIDAPLVTVETHLTNGLAGFNIVGLPAVAVKESRDRVRSAIANTHLDFPVRKITVNLAPADLPKEGGRFDLPIALGILAASSQLPKDIFQKYEFVGELALSGELRSVRGVFPVALQARKAGRILIVPDGNAQEAGLVSDAAVLSAKTILEVCDHLKDEKQLQPFQAKVMEERADHFKVDMADVKGQPLAKRALAIAASGKHSLLFVGPPGTGKTMLASRLPTIMPSLLDKHALEVAAIASVSSAGFNPKNWKTIPFRAPHHSSSSVALVGGGRPPRPGEISLAHRGVLFLDELPEFHRHVLECLREPLESGTIAISRAAFQTCFPANFQLIAAMNPCPCGYAGEEGDACYCSKEQIQKYIGKISGPLLDRIDMQMAVSKLSADVLTNKKDQSEASKVIRQKVIAAQAIQMKRQGKYNASLTASELQDTVYLQKRAEILLGKIMAKWQFSARVYHRLVKVARTIADFENSDEVTEQHISEALQFRRLDKHKI